MPAALTDDLYRKHLLNEHWCRKERDQKTCYCTAAYEEVNALIYGVDEKTFRKWSWTVVDQICDIKVVRVLMRAILLILDIFAAALTKLFLSCAYKLEHSENW